MPGGAAGWFFRRPSPGRRRKNCSGRWKAGTQHGGRRPAAPSSSTTCGWSATSSGNTPGCIGLIKAADTFSPEKKIRFSSYAAKCVQNEILMVLRAGKKSARDVSLSDPIESDRDGNPLTVGDLIADDQDLPALIDRRLDAEKLAALVAGLPARERQVVRMRYGLSGGAPLTQQEIARKLGISRSYVSRIEKKAIASLREGFGE